MVWNAPGWVAGLARTLLVAVCRYSRTGDSDRPLTEPASTFLPTADEPARMRHIGDFIAGMTDRYAVTRYREAIGPVTMPDDI